MYPITYSCQNILLIHTHTYMKGYVRRDCVCNINVYMRVSVHGRQRNVWWNITHSPNLNFTIWGMFFHTVWKTNCFMLLHIMLEEVHKHSASPIDFTIVMLTALPQLSGVRKCGLLHCQRKDVRKDWMEKNAWVTSLQRTTTSYRHCSTINELRRWLKKVAQAAPTEAEASNQTRAGGQSGLCCWKMM